MKVFFARFLYVIGIVIVTIASLFDSETVTKALDEFFKERYGE